MAKHMNEGLRLTKNQHISFKPNDSIATAHFNSEDPLGLTNSIAFGNSRVENQLPKEQ